MPSSLAFSTACSATSSVRWFSMTSLRAMPVKFILVAAIGCSYLFLGWKSLPNTLHIPDMPQVGKIYSLIKAQSKADWIKFPCVTFRRKSGSYGDYRIQTFIFMITIGAFTRRHVPGAVRMIVADYVTPASGGCMAAAIAFGKNRWLGSDSGPIKNPTPQILRPKKTAGLTRSRPAPG